MPATVQQEDAPALRSADPQPVCSSAPLRGRSFSRKTNADVNPPNLNESFTGQTAWLELLKPTLCFISLSRQFGSIRGKSRSYYTWLHSCNFTLWHTLAGLFSLCICLSTKKPHLIHYTGILIIFHRLMDNQHFTFQSIYCANFISGTLFWCFHVLMQETFYGLS